MRIYYLRHVFCLLMIVMIVIRLKFAYFNTRSHYLLCLFCYVLRCKACQIRTPELAVLELKRKNSSVLSWQSRLKIKFFLKYMRPLLRQQCWRRWKEKWKEEIRNRTCWFRQGFSWLRIYHLQMENPQQTLIWPFNKNNYKYSNNFQLCFVFIKI